VGIREGFKGEARTNPYVINDLLLDGVIAKGDHSTVGVVKQDDFAGAKEPLADDERSYCILGDHSAGKQGKTHEMDWRCRSDAFGLCRRSLSPRTINHRAIDSFSQLVQTVHRSPWC